MNYEYHSLSYNHFYMNYLYNDDFLNPKAYPTQLNFLLEFISPM